MRKITQILLRCILVFPVAQGCSNKNMIDLPQGFTFGYTESKGYTNVYLHELPVIPGGCDSVQWTDDLIVAKGSNQRYMYREGLLQRATNVDSIKNQAHVYFIINANAYKKDARQEQSQGFNGPFTKAELIKQVPFTKKKFTGVE